MSTAQQPSTSSVEQSVEQSVGQVDQTVEQARAAIRALNEEYIEAVRTADASWFRDHMAEDVVVVLGGGQRLGKDQFVALVEAGGRRFRSLTVRDVTVRIYGTAAQVDADAPWEQEDGKSGVSRYIDTYAWLGGRWQVVSAQITLLPQDGRP
jgi:uncharacterized protein (TIGR02246 family)